MGRPKVKVVVSEAVRAELKTRLAAAKDSFSRIRLQAIKLATSGQHSLQEIAEAVGYARSGIQTFIRHFNGQDFAALLARKKAPGKATAVSPAIQAALQAGLREGRWRTAGQVRAWLHKEHGIRLAEPSIYYWLGKLGGTLKVPRPAHLKKDPAQGAEFQAHLYEKLQALDLPAGRPVKIWVADEMRHGLKPVVRRCWSLRGTRVIQVQHPRFSWGYTWAALECVEGAREVLFSNSVNLETSQKFLEQLVASAPEAEHVVIWDGAGFHPIAASPHVPAHVHVLRLPAYSPELNPVERLWDQAKDVICNQLYATVEALEEAIQAALTPFADAARVLSLIGSGWLHTQANDSHPGIVP